MTPAAPAASPLIDLLTPVEDNLKLDIKKFILHNMLHSNAVLPTDHTDKPITSVSDSGQALRKMQEQQPEMIAFSNHYTFQDGLSK